MITDAFFLAVAIPAVPVMDAPGFAPSGIWLGVWRLRRLSQELFYRVAYTMPVVAGAKLLRDGGRALAA